MAIKDELLDKVSDLIVDHKFEVIDGEDFEQYHVKQHEFDYDAVDTGYDFYSSIKVGQAVYEGMGLKISINWSCMTEADDFGSETDSDFAFDYTVEQVAIVNGLMTIV